MEEQAINPLVVRCKNCGGELSFDIVKQQYVCAHCGTTLEQDSQKAEFKNWKSTHQDHLRQHLDQAKLFKCPACGAQTMTSSDEATASCPFCQNTMIDTEFAGNDLPEVIIPFKISKEEAETRLKAWLDNHKNNPAASAIEQNLQHFSGCYLPYHIVRGAIHSSLQIRTGKNEASDYPFRAYLSHSTVNASKEWDNLFLNGIEPFEFNEAREFNFGYLNHQNAKVQNVTNEELNARVDEETKAKLYESLSQKNGTKELSIRLDGNDNESIPALLPVYLVKAGDGIAAAVNGQTGKISVATGKSKDLSRFWWIAPSVATLIITIATCILGGMKNGLWIGLGIGAIIYAIANSRHKAEIIKEVLTYPDTGKSHSDIQAEFFTDFGDGPVPAQIKFFTPWRIIKSVLVVMAVIALPILIAIPIQLLRAKPLSDIQLAYGAGWYFIFGFVGILSLTGMAKTLMYKAPIYREIFPENMTKDRKPRFKKHSLLSSFISNYKETLSTQKGILFTIFMVLLLAGSVLFMIY